MAFVFISRTRRPRPALIAVLLINKIPDDFRFVQTVHSASGVIIHKAIQEVAVPHGPVTATVAVQPGQHVRDGLGDDVTVSDCSAEQVWR